MSYEEEQNKLLQECNILQIEYDFLKQYFEQNPDAKKRDVINYDNPYEYSLLVKQACRYNIDTNYEDSNKYIYYKIVEAKLQRCKYRLNQSKTSRAVENGIDFIWSIIPQHVGGRTYKVENGDGCGTFCMWFILIDALIMFIWYLISGGK